MQTIPFSDLETADLRVDAVYQGGRKGNSSDDPYTLLLKVSNSGGFRYRGKLNNLQMVVLTSNLSDPDWPDALDRETGIYTYYGDNKKPGVALHETPRKGNELLRNIFENSNLGKDGRSRVPPIFIFHSTGSWRDVIFLGLAIPGTSDARASEDLVAIWKIASNRRFQNYRARFTILDVPVISRKWVDEIISGNVITSNAPTPWRHWLETGQVRPLIASRSIEHRTRKEQVPHGPQGMEVIKTLRTYFAKTPHKFEGCAAAIARMLLPDIASMDLTRPSRDGGRDAIGYLRIGSGPASILVDFALEAKCYALDNAAGVREMSRLISRLRHRQFGIFVTTSYLDLQAYKEIKEDEHPIVVIAAADIVELLKRNGLYDAKSVLTWIQYEFPLSN